MEVKIGREDLQVTRRTISMAFLNDTKTNLDTNLVGDKTSSIDITEQTLVTWRIVPVSGSHDIHRVSLQVSYDNVTFKSANAKLEGADVESTKTVAHGYIRFRVSKAEGSTSKVDILINAK